MKKISLLLALAGLSIVYRSSAISLDDIQFWTGSGTNRAGLVIEWNSPVAFNQTGLPAPITTKTMVWGYRFNGTPTATQMLNAIVGADRRLYAIEWIDPMYGTDLAALGYNLDGTGQFGVSDGTNTYQGTNFVNNLLTVTYANRAYMDAATNLNTGDLYWGGNLGPNWVQWSESNYSGGFSNSPNRGSSQYYDTNSGTHGAWWFGGGMDYTTMLDGSWMGFTVSGAGYPTNTNDITDMAIFNADEQAPPDPAGNYTAYVVNTNDFVVQVVSATNLSGAGLYSNAAAMLGRPTLRFLDNEFGVTVTDRVSLVDPPYNVMPNGQPTLTVVLSGGEVSVNMGRKIYHDPGNPYGMDFTIYGYSLFSSSSGFVSDATDLTTARVAAPYAGHSNVVSVSQDGTNWYVYSNVAVTFPTESYRWDETNQSWTDEQFNPTKPVNPTLYSKNFVGTSVAGTLDQFNGSAGGTSYSLQPSGLPWIQYIQIQSPTNYYTVIDAIAAVDPVMVGDALSIGPTNLAAGVTNLTFRKQDGTSSTLINLNFSSLSDVAKVSTITLSDFSSYAPVYGNVSSAYQITAKAQNGGGPVNYVATVGLRAGQNYSGGASNLVVYEWTGTNWAPQSFAFDPASQEVSITGVTNLSAFVVSQISSPQLGIAPATNYDGFQFAPMPGVQYTLQRSVDLINWTNITSVTPQNGQTVNLQDNSPPAGKAFYRLVAP